MPREARVRAGGSCGNEFNRRAGRYINRADPIEGETGGGVSRQQGIISDGGGVGSRTIALIERDSGVEPSSYSIGTTTAPTNLSLR